MKFDIKASGVNGVMKRFKHFFDSSTETAVGNAVETYARKMASDASDNAPILDGYLKGSLASSPEKFDKTTWTFGSDLPYARRQEYEHASKKGFVRRSIWANRTAYRNAIKKGITRGGR